MMQTFVVKRLRLGALVGLSVALLLIILWGGGALQTLQLRLTDAYYLPEDTSGQVVILTIDDASLQRYGRSPAQWSRQTYADIVTALNQAGARVVAFDLLFTEPTENDDVLIQALTDARRSESRTRFVLAAAGVQRYSDTASLLPTLYYNEALMPLDELTAIADTIGFVNAFPDIDSTIRRQPSLVYYDDTLYTSYSVATFLAYNRIPAAAFSQLIQPNTEKTEIRITDNLQLPVDENGIWLQNFYGAASTRQNQTFPIVPVVDLLEGDADPALFDDKIVLVGLFTITGDADRYRTPTSEDGALIAGVEIQANAIESLLQRQSLREISPIAEALIIVTLSVITSLIYVYPRWGIKLLLMGILTFVVLLISLLIFNTQQIIIPALYPMLAVILPVPMIIGLDVSRQTFLRQYSDFLLTSMLEASQQRLQLNAILDLLIDDIKTIVPDARGALYQLEADAARLYKLWSQTDEPSYYAQLAENAAQSQTDDSYQNTLAIPVSWQGHTSVVMLVTHPDASQRRVTLKDLADRLAPTLANAALYQEVQQQQETLSTVIGNTPSAVILFDNDYRVRIHNRSASHLFDADTLEGESLTDLLDTVNVSEKAKAQLLDYLQQSDTFRHELPLGEATYQVDSALIPDLNQWVMVFSDITNLIELSNLKTRMLRMASHDLKNPLGRISGYAQLLEMRPDLDEKSLKYIGYIEDATHEMNTLILDILDLERMRSGHVNLEKLDFTDLVTQVYRRHEPDATRKEQTYSADMPATPLYIMGDVRQLSQVVSNLIGNAIKYTPEEGTITVRVIHTTTQAQFFVQDTGYGIAQEAQEKLFTEFYRVQTDKTATIKGTGLGLSLVKSVVDAHNGVVGVDSEEGEGSTFYVYLPLAPTDEETSA